MIPANFSFFFLLSSLFSLFNCPTSQHELDELDGALIDIRVSIIGEPDSWWAAIVGSTTPEDTLVQGCNTDWHIIYLDDEGRRNRGEDNGYEGKYEKTIDDKFYSFEMKYNFQPGIAELGYQLERHQTRPSEKGWFGKSTVASNNKRKRKSGSKKKI